MNVSMNMSIISSSSSSASNRRNPNLKSRWFQIRNSNSEDCLFREEQRWLREEQRWLREEKRWLAERESLLRQISQLKANNQQQVDVVLKDVPRIAQTGCSQKMLLLETTTATTSTADDKPRTRKTLKKGLQGEDVRLMQEALLKLGFYSGEEDMEYSTFSTGTHRAVKTWQASLDLPEDGVMTPHLLQILYQPQAKSQLQPTTTRTQTQTQTPQKGKPDLTKPRVFLLGENRWEEPSRLIARDTPKCPACHGQGRILCMECDGTGEPNIEEQFMEWVDEGAKCPYCDGIGEVACDLCAV